MRGFLPLVSVALLGVGCGPEEPPPPADVAGNYSVNTTNRENECALENWEVGGTATGIRVAVTQDEADAQLVVQDLVGAYLTLVVGGNIFVGEVEGDHVSADLIGSRAYSQGSCTYTLRVELDADLTVDTLNGTLFYRPITNMHPDCGILDTCANEQAFNGTRPPS